MTQPYNLDEVRQAIEWIITTRPDLVTKAQLIIEGKYNPHQDTEEDQKILHHLKNLLIVDYNDLHGRVYVTEAVETHSKITAGSITFANWINCVSNFPLFLFMVQNIHPVIGFTSALASTGILLGTGNVLGASVARYKKGNRIWSLLGGFVGLMGLNILQTATTGIGVELFNNRSQFDRIYATQIADNYLDSKDAEISRLSEFDDPIYQNLKQQCETGQAKLESLSVNHPQRDSLHVQLFGTFAQRNDQWETKPFQQLPLCRQVTRLEDKQNQLIETASAHYHNLLLDRTQTGSDIKFLQTVAPNLFQEHFTKEGQIKSGTVLVGLATTQVYSKLFNGEWSQLGLSLFMFLLSGITSLASCAMALSHALSKEVQLSYNQELQSKIDEHFQGLYFALMSAQKQGESLIPELDSIRQNLENTLHINDAENNSFTTSYSPESLPSADEEEWTN
ncbi:hypothetical protein ACN4EE_08625 [Geminocystis sp. CENA526]|uniref:hypothetical protein n=1 Tax=Geminocystis sp. CENA526 TaxID=1355871 RepID=UPI003D6F9ACF